MGQRMTTEEFLERVFSRSYEELRGRELRLVRVKVVGREVSLAQLIGVSDRRIYENLGLHIGTHLGEDHTGESIGLLHITPWEATVAAADIAMKSGDVELGFLDRFSGAVILLGNREEVKTSLRHVLDFFRDELGFPVCELTER
ncbi:BMC domain-containing protein [Intestinimonas sp. HCP28S3_D6]|uniref:BMC domain-containing protein n=1 Tax=Intestinimonas sp. HCP28S3_D6 TaxID=3438942 RepID=UPI003F8C8ED4